MATGGLPVSVGFRLAQAHAAHVAFALCDTVVVAGLVGLADVGEGAPADPFAFAESGTPRWPATECPVRGAR